MLHILHLIFVYKCLYIKFLNSFFLPDVSSSTLLVFSATSVVSSTEVYPFSTSSCQVAFSSGVVDNLFCYLHRYFWFICTYLHGIFRWFVYWNIRCYIFVILCWNSVIYVLLYSSFTVIHIFGYMVFFIYMFSIFPHVNSSYRSILQFSNHDPVIHIDFFIFKYIYCNVAEIYHTCYVHIFSTHYLQCNVIWHYQLSDIIITMIILTMYYASQLYTSAIGIPDFFYIYNLFYVPV